MSSVQNPYGETRQAFRDSSVMHGLPSGPPMLMESVRPGQSSQTKELAVPRALGRLQHLVGELEEANSVLVSRLEPVLRQEPGGADPCEKRGSEGCKVSEYMQLLADRLEAVIKNTQMVARQLEI